MTPELKRAIIKFVPDYFSWDLKRQERYRVEMLEDDAFNIRRFLLEKLFDISVLSDDEMDDAWREMSEAQCSKINGILLPLQGVGEDFFYLNEFFRDQQNLLSFVTLYDYDFDDYLFQEDSREKDIKNYERKAYRGSLYFTWARLMVDGTFSYGVLSMVAGYLHNQIDEFGCDYIETLIPHEFKHGKNHGKAEGDGYLFDLKTNARGLEAQLDELKHRFWKHIATVYDRLLDEFDKKSEQRVFILNQSMEGDPSHLFLFTDKDILKRILFRNFMRDCRIAEQTDHASLIQKSEEEKELLKNYLDTQYKDIMDNFDPKVVKLRKKRKVLIQRGSGLDELLD